MKETRDRVAKAVRDALQNDRRFEQVSVDGDRISLIAEGYAVTLIVSTASNMVPDDATTCPFCGRADIRKFDDSTCLPRRGCLGCNMWLDPVRLRRP